jgi:hypothetical protein
LLELTELQVEKGKGLDPTNKELIEEIGQAVYE